MADRVLLIEDDRELGAQIVATLQRAGLGVTWWTEGRVPDPAEIDLLIVDLMLPGVYGLDILKALRARSDTPALVLSARNDTNDKIRALKLGADDYMTKPFWPEELVERVRARLRRPTLARSDVIEVGDLRIGVAERQAWVADRAIELTRAEFDLLAALARRPGAAVTRAALVDAALDAERDGAERTLDVHVSRLRKKLGDAGLIQTVWGVGYRLATSAPA
ncbi:MAG: response regulator transcription factor [Myxococcales bacterium]|nr:response regulator transcription factor [Myxococcales bacterium]